MLNRDRLLTHLRKLVALLILVSAVIPARSNEPVVLEIETNRMVYDEVRDLVYATVPGIVPKLGNRVIALDPLSLEIVDSVYVGSEPESIDISESCQTLYVALRGAPKIVRVDVPSFSVSQIIDLGVTPTQLPKFAFGLEVMPGSEDVLAVMRTGAIAIYDNGVERPLTVNTSNDVWSIAFSHEPARVYANGSGSPSPFYRLQVSAAGISVVSSTNNLISGASLLIYAGGRMYVRNFVFDPEALVPLGTYAESGLVAPDVVANKVTIIDREVQTTNVYTFDLPSFELLATTEYYPFSSPKTFLRWGDSGIIWSSGDELISARTSQVWFDLHVAPDSFNPLRGLILTGGLQEVVSSDDQRMVLRPGPVFSTQQSPISVEFAATAPTLAEEHFSFTIESHATSANIRQSVFLFDYDAQTFVLFSEKQSSTSDAKAKVEVWDAADRFIDDNGNIKARVDYRATGPVFIYPWEARIDLIQWTFINK